MFGAIVLSKLSAVMSFYVQRRILRYGQMSQQNSFLMTSLKLRQLDTHGRRTYAKPLHPILGGYSNRDRCWLENYGRRVAGLGAGRCFT